MVLSLRDWMRAGPGAKRPLTRDEMLAFARGVDLDKMDLGPYRGFQDGGYARNTVELNENFELVVICWKPGQASAIHDHGKSNCLYLVVEGDMTEELYARGERGQEPRKTRTRPWKRGDITISAGTDIHRISNQGTAPLVTVHIYSPPLRDTMTLFSPDPHAG
jgi:cysteine dioxygenase